MLDLARQLLSGLRLIKRASPENPSTRLSNPDAWLVEWAGGGKSSAGIAVTPTRALGVATAYACVRVIAEAIATLPLHVYRRSEGRREPADDHPHAFLLSESPNEVQSAVTWMDLMMTHVLLWGNHYAVIGRRTSGRIGGFYPVMPWQVVPRLSKSGREKFYEIYSASGKDVVADSMMLHVMGLSQDGISGIPPVQRLRNMYGLAIAAEDFGARFFANDARPGVILETPGKMRDEAQANLVKSIYEKYSGAENRWKVLVLEEGAKMHMVQMPLEDAQFLETRQMQDTQIAAVFKVPPHMVGMQEKATAWGTGIEQMDIGFAKHTILPWCRRIESELQRKIFAGSEYFARFSLEGLMRGDVKTRNEAFAMQVQNGIRTRNEGGEVVVSHVLDGGAAQRAGLSAGDTLVAFDSLRVSGRDLEEKLDRIRPGRRFNLHAFRRDELMVFEVTPTAPPKDTCALLALPGPQAARKRRAWLRIS